MAAHGGEYKVPFREVAELSMKVQVMLFRLVLTLIGYQGPYTDYGTPGWPACKLGVQPPVSLGNGEKATSPAKVTRKPTTKRKPMSATARRAISQGMKASWAKRKKARR